MGNGQSAEAPRRPPNKLSKPKTNVTTTTLLNLKTAGPPTHRNSQLNDGANKYSTVFIDAEAKEEHENRESKQKKRMSMFRSKSAQPKAEPLQINTGVDIEYLDRSPMDNWPARGFVTHGSPDQPYFTPLAER